MTDNVLIDCLTLSTTASLIARLIAEDSATVITTQGLLNADCNGDGNRTSEDVTRLLQYIAKMIPEI